MFYADSFPCSSRLPFFPFRFCFSSGTNRRSNFRSNRFRFFRRSLSSGKRRFCSSNRLCRSTLRLNDFQPSFALLGFSSGSCLFSRSTKPPFCPNRWLSYLMHKPRRRTPARKRRLMRLKFYFSFFMSSQFKVLVFRVLPISGRLGVFRQTSL